MNKNFAFGILLIFSFLALVLGDFKQDCLNAHNRYRDKHATPHLHLDRAEQASAQNYANILAARNNGLSHSRSGENLWALYGSTNIGGATAVDSWYSEIKFYNYNNPGFSKATVHFTQVVWKSSQRLGCAFATNGNNIYVVAHYAPPGNIEGLYRENVLPPK